MELVDLIRKGTRIQRPVVVRLNLRPGLYEWFCELSDSGHCGLNVLLVGILEDFYDKHSESEAP